MVFFDVSHWFGGFLPSSASQEGKGDCREERWLLQPRTVRRGRDREGDGCRAASTGQSDPEEPASRSTGRQETLPCPDEAKGTNCEERCRPGTTHSCLPNDKKKPRRRLFGSRILKIDAAIVWRLATRYFVFIRDASVMRRRGRKMVEKTYIVKSFPA